MLKVWLQWYYLTEFPPYFLNHHYILLRQPHYIFIAFKIINLVLTVKNSTGIPIQHTRIPVWCTGILLSRHYIFMNHHYIILRHHIIFFTLKLFLNVFRSIKIDEFFAFFQWHFYDVIIFMMSSFLWCQFNFFRVRVSIVSPAPRGPVQGFLVRLKLICIAYFKITCFLNEHFLHAFHFYDTLFTWIFLTCFARWDIARKSQKFIFVRQY